MRRVDAFVLDSYRRGRYINANSRINSKQLIDAATDGGRHRRRVALALAEAPAGGARATRATKAQRRLGLHGGSCVRRSSRSKNPREVAQAIVDHMPENDLVESVEIAGPGFINIRLARGRAAGRRRPGACREGRLRQERACPRASARSTSSTSPPTPPARCTWAMAAGRALGDATARVMRHAGYDVYEEFYINDHGTQMDNFGESVSRALPAAARPRRGDARGVLRRRLREGHRPGHHRRGRRQMARTPTRRGARGELPRDAPTPTTLARTSTSVTEPLRHHVRHAGSPSASLYVPDENGESAVSRCLDGHGREGLPLREGRRHCGSRSSAFWATRRTACSSRATARCTYFMSDVAYHYNKMDARLRPPYQSSGAPTTTATSPAASAMLEPRGAGPARWRCMLGQLVNLFRDGKAVRMSKRTGEMITFEELIDEVGVDATRYLMLAKLELTSPSTSTSRWRRRRTPRTRCTTCSTPTRASAPSCARRPTRPTPRPPRTAEMTMDELAAKVIPEPTCDLTPLTHRVRACAHAQDGRLRPRSVTLAARDRARVPPHALRARTLASLFHSVLHELPRASPTTPALQTAHAWPSWTPPASCWP